MKKQTPKVPPVSTLTPAAYSYIRFSSPEQAEGDSLRRQTQKTADWCEKTGVYLDTSLTLRDLGVSAFKGRHHRNDKHALAQFLKLVERGRIPKGSYLVIENLDRLSREDERSALRLWMDILDAGINIVQLFPETVFRHEKSDMVDIMRAIIELSRGHSESAIKSERVASSWQERRRESRESGTILTRRLPAWVEERGGKLHLIPKRAAVVKRIFHLAAAGYGHVLIVRKLHADGVPAFGLAVVREGRKRPAFSGHWTRSYIALLLRDRRAMGELQPRLQDGTPDGPPIPNYYPAAITEAEWHAARAGASQRGRKPGRTSNNAVNLFAGLLWDARNAEPYYIASRKTRSGGLRRVVFNAAAHAGRASYYSFPADTFEDAVLGLLAEIDPRDLLADDNGPDEVMELSGAKARIETRIAELEAELVKGDVAAVVKVLRQLEAKDKELSEQLAKARQKAAHPLSESWGETQSLLSTIDAAPDPTEARLRLRAALQRIVDSVWLLVVHRGQYQLCAVQVRFVADERHRDYFILHRNGTGGAVCTRPPQWWSCSLASLDVAKVADLRKRGEARELESALADVNVEMLKEAMAELLALKAGGKRG
jgi:DNA invertase Pin-like site-specific DNA recombinase